MALKTTIVPITEGRDKGKRFKIGEVPAKKIERWILRAVFGLGKSGVEIPPEVFQLGAAAVAYVIASKASQIPSRLGLRLADELMEYVEIVEPKVTRPLVDEDIEDVTTRLKLKSEVLKLTFGFFDFAASLSSGAPESGTESSSQ